MLTRALPSQYIQSLTSFSSYMFQDFFFFWDKVSRINWLKLFDTELLEGLVEIRATCSIIKPPLVPIYNFFFWNGSDMELNHNKESFRNCLQSRIENTSYIISAWIKEVTQRGVTPIQRCWVLDLLASWASSWATELKFLLKCLKRQVSKDSLTWRIPCTMCP